MKTGALFILTALLCACSAGEPHQYTRIKQKVVCGEEVTKLRAEFTLECIKNANPNSDEEPEDWIHKCEDMAENLYCEVIPHKVTYHSVDADENLWRDEEIEAVPVSGQKY